MMVLNPTAERLALAERLRVRSAGAGGGCLVWTGRTDKDGYGRTSVRNRNLRTHRVAYDLFVGVIPDGLTLDHTCRNRACMNPEHLEPVPSAVNVLRGESPSAVNARKTECKRGHAFTDANTYVNKNGARVCRACGLAAQHVYLSTHDTGPRRRELLKTPAGRERNRLKSANYRARKRQMQGDRS